ncbi:MAG: hypothetical protein ACFFAS_05225 [Promethearchaeota archaeon]
MATKKKKGKKKKEKKQDDNQAIEEETVSKAPTKDQSIPETSLDKALLGQKGEAEELDVALEGAMETQEALQGLLSNISKGDGFYKSQIKVEVEEEKVKPQLSYNRDEIDIVKDFLIEDIPLTERKIGRSEIKQRTRLVDSTLKKKPVLDAPPPPKKIEIAKKTPVKVVSPEQPDKGGQFGVKDDKSIEETAVEKDEKPEKPVKESIYPKLETFFTGLINGYGSRYKQWEDSISSVLSVLRKMRKVTKANTEDLVKTITRSYEKVQKGLNEFVIKRNEIEKIAEIDIESLSGQFKNVLGMLELQVKEYQLKRLADEYIHNL